MNFSLLNLVINKQRWWFHCLHLNKWDLIAVGTYYKFNSCRVWNSDEMHPKIFILIICGITIIERLVK